MAHRLSPPRRKDAIATRARLVRAALELFTTDGYRGTTTLDIAAKAGTAEATIYRHFTGKEALFNEAYREGLRFGIAVIREHTAERGARCRERLRGIGKGLVQGAARDPAVVAILLHRLSLATLDEASLTLSREFRDLLGQVMASGKQEGTIRAGSAELWSSVWLALVTFAADRVAARDWSWDHPSVGQTLDAAWDAIAYRAEASSPG
jgi:AcrR family transcriptional regulator